MCMYSQQKGSGISTSQDNRKQVRDKLGVKRILPVYH